MIALKTCRKFAKYCKILFLLLTPQMPSEYFIFALTVPRFSNLWPGSIAGFTRTGFVYGTDTELILRSFYKVRHCSFEFFLIRRGRNIYSFRPVSIFILLFNAIALNRSTAIIFRSCPAEVNVVTVPVINVWCARLIRLVCEYFNNNVALSNTTVTLIRMMPVDRLQKRQ